MCKYANVLMKKQANRQMSIVPQQPTHLRHIPHAVWQLAHFLKDIKKHLQSKRISLDLQRSVSRYCYGIIKDFSLGKNFSNRVFL